MIKEEIKKSFLVISSPPFGGKHSTVKYSYTHYTASKLYKQWNNLNLKENNGILVS